MAVNDSLDNVKVLGKKVNATITAPTNSASDSLVTGTAKAGSRNWHAVSL